MAKQPDRDKDREKVRKISQGVKKRYTRRDFLKTAGAAAGLGAASTLGIQQLIQQNNSNSGNRRHSRNTATAAATGGQDYETIEVNAGDTHTISAGSGETVENKLIDITANGADCRIVGNGDGFTIRNIGVRGKIGDDGYILGAKASGLFENIYIGDGSAPGRAKGGYLAHKDTQGPVTFRNVHVSKFGNNGLYVSPTSQGSTGAVVHIEDSYFGSNNISNFKIGSPYGTCTVKNTTIRTDQEVPHNGYDQINRRGFIALNGRTEVRNCDIQGRISVKHKHNNSTEVELYNTRWEGQKIDNGTLKGSSSGTPDLTPPEGVPMTPEEAASGTSTGGNTGTDGSSGLMEDIDTGPGPHTITLEGGSQNDPKNYIIKADNLEKQQGSGKILGATATGILRGNTHQYRYEGDIYDVRLEDGAQLSQNGQELNGMQIAALCNNPASTGSGGSGTGGGSSGGGSCTPGGDYKTIEVGAGETFRKNIGDGETWENVLIDITASGAVYEIQADGTYWTIRNIGVKGHFEGGHTEPFRARVTDSNGSATIRNVHLAPTQGDGNATGIYVYWNHAGHLDIDRVNVQNWTDNAIYASGPGNTSSHSSPGSHGTVHITNCYSKNNDKSNFRLGTDGSKLENCCDAGGSSRGHWQFYNHSEIIDCDLASGIALGDAVWDNNASVTCTNSRWNGEKAHGNESTSNINGTSQGEPRDRVPEGCPTSPEEAAGCQS